MEFVGIIQIEHFVGLRYAEILCMHQQHIKSFSAAINSVILESKTLQPVEPCNETAGQKRSAIIYSNGCLVLKENIIRRRIIIVRREFWSNIARKMER